MGSQREYLIKLRELLEEHFNLEELQTLCFDLGVDYDNLIGAGKSSKARELVAFLKRRNRIPDLVAACKQLRPDAAWDDDGAASPPPTPLEEWEKYSSPDIRIAGVSTKGFIGRTSEMDRYANRLETTHFALIVGAGGIGKSTLALKLALRVSPPTQAFWHTFMPGEDTIDIIWQLAVFLAHHGQRDVWHDIQHASQTRESESRLGLRFNLLVQQLSDHGYLLCLDNLQSVKNPLAEQFVKRLWQAAQEGKLSLLITSRHLPPFASIAEKAELTGLCLDDARDLLQHNGILILADLIVELHRRTEGNPEFLRLAMISLQRSDDPAQFIANLASQQDIENYLLNEVDAGLTDEQRTIMVAVAALLGFGGTIDLVAAVVEYGNVRRTLSELSQQYLLSVNESITPKEYNLHTIVQTFYYTDPRFIKERPMLHKRAGSYYETRAHDMLKAARHYALAGEYAHAATLVTDNLWAIINQGQIQALREVLDQFTPDRVDREQWPAVCTARGEVCALLGEFTTAQVQFEEALQHGLAQAPNRVQIKAQARCYRLLALVNERTGNYQQAEDDCRRGLALTNELASPNIEAARLYTQLAEVLFRQRHLEDAEQACNDGLAALPPAPESPFERASLGQRLATILGERGDYPEAIRQLEQSLQLAQISGDRALIAQIQNNLGLYYYQDEQFAQAEQFYQESIQIKEQIGDIAGRLTTLINLGLVYMDRSRDLKAALRCFTECAIEGKRLKMPDIEAHALNNSGQVQLEQGHLDEAHASLLAAEAIYHTLGSVLDRADCFYRLGDVALAQHQPEVALDYGNQALTLAKEMADDTYESCARRVIGEALLAQGRLDDAEVSLDAALEKCRDPYDRAMIEQDQERLEQIREHGTKIELPRDQSNEDASAHG